MSVLDGGRRHLIIARDLNMRPEESERSGLLELHGLSIITDRPHGTCKHSSGWSLLNFIICSTDLLPLVSNVQMIAEVRWAPHLGLTFDLSRRPEDAYVQTFTKPKPLPDIYDEKEKATLLEISNDRWDQLVHDAEPLAVERVDGSAMANQDVWDCARRHGLGAPSRKSAIRYVQWSIAAEWAQIEVNDPLASRKTNGSRLGRGNLPVLNWENLRQTSARTKVEHVLWSLPQPFATVGMDLFAALWGTLPGILRRLAASSPVPDQVARCIVLYFPFFDT